MDTLLIKVCHLCHCCCHPTKERQQGQTLPLARGQNSTRFHGYTRERPLVAS